MRKREKIRLIQRVARYLTNSQKFAIVASDEDGFDWYGDGFRLFFWCVSGHPERYRRIERIRDLKGNLISQEQR